MPPKPFTHRFMPFTGGQNTVRDPQALASGNPQAPEEGVRAISCDLRGGLLRGVYGPGSAVLPPPVILATTRFIYYVEGTGWVAKQMNTDFVRQNWAVRDGHGTWGQVTYMTDVAADGTPSVPRIRYGGGSYPMGLTKPAVPTSNGVGAGANIQVRVTYVVKPGSAVLLESNPSTRQDPGVYFQAGDTITAVDPTATQTRVTHWRLYATKPGDPEGLMYLLDEVAFPTVTSVIPNPMATGTPDVTQPLNWDEGGHPGDNIAVEDHAPALALTCMSNAMHGGENLTDGNATGRLAAAIDHWAVMSAMGQPQYWPAKNTYRLPEPTLAIISIGTTSYYFTQTGCWAFSGAGDAMPEARRTKVSLGPMLAAGKSVVSTRYGILYVSREGVMLFDGDAEVNLTREILLPSEIQASDYWCAGFVDDFYIFSNAEDTVYMLDMRGFPNRIGLVKAANSSALPPAAFHSMPTIGSLAEGLYIGFTGDASLRQWRPDSRTLVTGASRLASQYKTGRLTFGDATRHKKLTKYRLDGTGPVTMKVFVNPTDMTSDTGPALTVALTLPMREARWFPSTCAGKTFAFLFDVPSGSEIAAGSHVEGVLCG